MLFRSVAITGAAQNLDNGVVVTFGATTGHYLNDKWDFNCLGYPAPPKAKGVLTRGGRVWGIDDDTLYWSAAGDETNWGGYYGEGGEQPIAPGEYGDLRDILDYQGVLYLFKDWAIFAVFGTDTENLIIEKVIEIDGYRPYSAAICPGGVAYATRSGVYPLGKLTAEMAKWTTCIETEARTMLQGQDFPYVILATSAAYSREMDAYLIWSVNTGTTVWASNQTNRPDVWTKLVFPTSPHVIYQAGLGNFYYGDEDGYVYKYVHTDFKDFESSAPLTPTAFTVSFKTGDWDMGDALHYKITDYVEGAFDPRAKATATVKFYENGSGTPSLTQSLVANARPVFSFPATFETLAVEIIYTALTGPCMYGGLSIWTRQGQRLV